MKRETVTVHGIERHYLIARGSPDAPILMMLHGTGSTAEWCDGETKLSVWAASHSYTLILPEGRAIRPERAPKFLTNPTRWNDGSTQQGDPLHSDADDVNFLKTIIETVVGRRGGVFLAGFSNGAGMGFRFAAEQPALVRGLFVVAGCRWTKTKPMRPVPTYYLLGEADPLLPLRGGLVRSPWGGNFRERPNPQAMFAAWAKDNGCEEFSETVDASGIRRTRYRGPVLMESAWLPGHGHHWPGGAGQLSPSLGGMPNTTLNANEELHQFLSRIQSESVI